MKVTPDGNSLMFGGGGEEALMNHSKAALLHNSIHRLCHLRFEKRVRLVHAKLLFSLAGPVVVARPATSPGGRPIERMRVKGRELGRHRACLFIVVINWEFRYTWSGEKTLIFRHHCIHCAGYMCAPYSRVFY